MNLESLPPGACIDPALYPELTAPRRFVRIEHFGSFCICSPENVGDWIADADDPSEYKITDVWMTQKEFDDLPEFKGF